MGPLARFRSSLTYPLAATLVLVTVVPVALVGWLLAYYNKDNLTTVEKQYLTRQAVGLASEVSLFVRGHRTALDSTVRALSISAEVQMDSVDRLLAGIASEPGRSFLYLRLLTRDSQGAFLQSPRLTPAGASALVAALDSAHETALTGRGTVEEFLPLPAPAPPAVVLVMPLTNRAGQVWGSLAGVIDFDPLQDRLNDNAYTGLLVSIIDERGTVVLSSRSDLRRRSFAGSALVQDFLGTPLRLNRVYDHPIDTSAGQVLGSVAPVPNVGWGVVVERPVAEAFATVKVMQSRTVLVSALAAVVALALGFLLSRQLVRPLQALDTVSTEIAEGNLEVRASVSGHNEIARLATNFNHMAGSVEALVRRLRHALRQNQELFLETIRTLAAAIDAKDPYTRGHSERVSSYSMAIGRHLGLNQDEIFRLRIAAILHDVGKLGIRDGILNKPAGLTDDEYAVMRKHAEIGAQIMSPIRMLKDIIPGIRNHHETWDGTGYPDALMGQEIPLVARIIGAADTFDAMTTTRPYQKAMTIEFVMEKMQSMSGSRFDPRIVDALAAAVNSGDITPPIREEAASVSAAEVS